MANSFSIECFACQCAFFSLKIDVLNAELRACCEMCQKPLTLSIDEFSVKMLKEREK